MCESDGWLFKAPFNYSEVEAALWGRNMRVRYTQETLFSLTNTLKNRIKPLSWCFLLRLHCVFLLGIT